MNEFTVDQSNNSLFLSNFGSTLLYIGLFVVVLIVFIYIVRKLFQKYRDKNIYVRNRSFSRLVLHMSQNKTGSDFEIWVKELLLSMGIQARVVGGRGDHGIDVVAEYNGKKICVQCKKYYMKRDSLMVGEPVLRDLYGAMYAGGFSKAVVITTGQFTDEAILWAKGKPELVLINAKLLEKIILNREILRELLS